MSTLKLKLKLFKWFCTITLATASVQIHAQTADRTAKIQMPIICGSLSSGYSAMSKYKEVPVFVGIDEQQEVADLMVVVFLNKETKTFTVSILKKESDLFCMLLTGQHVYDDTKNTAPNQQK